MTGSSSASSPKFKPSRIRRSIESIGTLGDQSLRSVGGFVGSLGAMAYLLVDSIRWAFKGIFSRKLKFGWPALFEQMVRVGVKSIAIVVLVQAFIGSILALQLAPTLASYGQLEKIADVVAIAIVRELGPLITAIVLSGYAGASIAAEIGSMVEAEEIKALRAHALNPIRFLIVPRFIATTVMIVGLAVIADTVGIAGGMFTSWAALGISPEAYLDSTRAAIGVRDFLTGLSKACIFGMLISMIACYEGLSVSGGAVGVGKATTATVVKSIVAVIGMDAVFTTIFYVFGL
ncbi:MAG: ABC transporter permease [Planctomycetes bacterium]|nr:ABC transporter permease [Planctomycetota bacterium]